MTPEGSQNPDPPPAAGVDPAASLGERAAGEEAADATNELLTRLSKRGTKSERLELEGEIGRGGMGAILKIWDADLRRHLAMKVVLGKSGAPVSRSLTTQSGCC